LQVIEKAAERGELTELVLMVIWNRLDVARRDVCKAQFWVILAIGPTDCVKSMNSSSSLCLHLLNLVLYILRDIGSCYSLVLGTSVTKSMVV
jgi:hypothetical protein